MRNKKATLELSINAIVIVVLAMTLLGLGLGFVRNMIGGLTETTGSVQEQVKQQILDDLRRGDKKLSFPSTELKTEISGEHVFAVGIKNTGDGDLKFKIRMYTLQGGNEVYMPSSSKAVSQTIGDLTIEHGFFFDESVQSLSGTEANVYALKYFAPGKSGSYMYKLKVCKETDDDDSMSGSAIADVTGMQVADTNPACDEYTSKTFFVNVR